MPSPTLLHRLLRASLPGGSATFRRLLSSSSSSTSSSSSSLPTAPAASQESSSCPLATVDAAARVLTLQRPSGIGGGASAVDASRRALRYPLAWLRDNCRCPLCHNPDSNSRQLLMNDFSPHSRVLDAQVAAGQLRLSWCDGHQSCYPLDWLERRHFTEDGQAPRDPRLDKAQPVLWRDRPYRVEFLDWRAVMAEDAAMLEMLQRLETDGLVFLDHCGTGEDAVSRLCHRVAYPRRTHYGVTFRVESKVGPSNLAYTAGFLGFHTDLPYFQHQPDIQLLHCVRQTKVTPGGENGFTDGFSAAELLRERRPDLFDILARTETNFRDQNSDDLDQFHLVQRHPVLELDGRGRVRRVHFSNQQRDSVLRLPIGQVQRYYEAMKDFNSLLYDPQHCVEQRLKDGQLMIFENGRVLHSRNAYQGSRLFLGAYLSWDETLSRRRVLQGLL